MDDKKTEGIEERDGREERRYRAGFDEDPDILLSQLNDLRTISTKVSQIDSKFDSLISTPITIEIDDSIGYTPYFKSLGDNAIDTSESLRDLKSVTEDFVDEIEESDLLQDANPLVGNKDLDLDRILEEDVTDPIIEGLDEISGSIDEHGDLIQKEIGKSSSRSSGMLGDLSLSGVSEWLITAAVTMIGPLINNLTSRSVSDIDSMRHARNDLMYERGVSAEEADELYRMRFRHEALPFMEESMPEYRERHRQSIRGAVTSGFTTEDQIDVASEKMTEYGLILPDVRLESSQFFKDSIRYLDETGDTVDAIMSKIRDTSRDLMVSPSMLADITDGYTKYFRFITDSNEDFTRSMNSVIETVGRMEDAQISSQGILGDITSFSMSSLDSASGQQMWTRLAMMGMDPMETRQKYMSGDVSGATIDYLSGVKSYFGELGYDGESGIDERFLTLANQLGFSGPSGVSELIDILQGNFETNLEESEGTGVDDRDKLLELKEDAYYDRALSGWTYITEEQKFQDSLTSSILENERLVESYESWNQMTKGLISIEGIVRGISSYLLGNVLLKGVKSIFSGGGLGGLFGGGAAATGGAATVGGASTVAGGAAAAGGGSTLISALSALAAPLAMAGGLAWGGLHAYRGVRDSEDWLGEEKGSSLSGKIMSGIGGFLGGTGPSLTDEDATTGEKALSIGSSTGKWALIGGAIGSIVPGIGTAVGAGVGALGGAIAGAISGEVISDALKTAWDATSEFALDSWEVIKEKSSDIWDSTKDFASSSWESITTTASDSWSFIKDVGIDSFNTAIGFGDLAMESFFSSMGLSWDEFKDDMSQTWDDFKEWGSESWSNIRELGIETWSNLSERAQSTWSNITAWSSETWASAKEGAQNLWSSFTSWGSESWDRLKESSMDLWDNTKQLGINAWQGIVDSYEGSLLEIGVDFVSDKASGLVNNFLGFFDKAKSRGEEITGLQGSGVMFSDEDFKQADDYWERVIEWSSSAWSSSTEGAREMWVSFSDLGSSVWSNLKEQSLSFWEDTKGWASSTWDNITDMYEGSWIESGVDLVSDGAGKVWDSVLNFFGSKDVDGSHETGLEYVPYDNYVANLHEGERVLTREENEEYTFTTKKLFDAISSFVSIEESRGDSYKEFMELNSRINSVLLDSSYKELIEMNSKISSTILNDAVDNAYSRTTMDTISREFTEVTNYLYRESVGASPTHEYVYADPYDSEVASLSTRSGLEEVSINVDQDGVIGAIEELTEVTRDLYKLFNREEAPPTEASRSKTSNLITNMI